VAALARAAQPRANVAILRRLALEDFRSYASAELRPNPGLTVVSGPNGAGKTNLLEAIFVAITGRSHRAVTDAELVRIGSPFARVRLELASLPGVTTVELVLPGATPPPGLRKRLTVNGVPRRASSVTEVARAVLFRPEEMMLLVGPPSDRRRFLDGILAQRDRRVARDLADLGRVVAQRNALLRAIRAEEADLGALAFWDEQLATIGARVMLARRGLVAELDRRIDTFHAAVVEDADSVDDRDTDADMTGRAGSRSLRLAYMDTLKEAWPGRDEARLPTPDELTAAFRTRIADIRQKEAWNGVSLVGPQRDDLRVELGGRDVALHASRGQQRTLILALKLVETELLAEDGPRPLILLDDVFSELDPRRARRLAALLEGRGQVIVTTADPRALRSVAAHDTPPWNIEAGLLIAPYAGHRPVNGDAAANSRMPGD
jgi:DNA replication and repair protein RecF